MTVEPAEAAAALAESWRFLCASVSGGWASSAPGATAGVTGVANPTLNGVLVQSSDADPAEVATITGYRKGLDSLTKFIPTRVKIAVAFALGLGTMIGWKRIVVTVGEKIGKSHLTYGQGAAAEIVTYATIQAADIYGLPVSTPHILSSGIAGTMAANGSGLQRETLRNILLAWVLTLPVCVLLGAALFAAGLFFVLRVAGVP